MVPDGRVTGRWMPYLTVWHAFRTVCRHATCRGDAKWLETYCHANFTLAMRQDLLHVDTQMRFALWRVGSLATADGRPIYGYFVRNSGTTPPPYFLVGFITLDDGILRYQVPGAVCELIRIDSPPVSPAHFVPPFPPLLPSTMWQHVLETRRERIGPAS
ncbi:MAG: hypothetical protein EBT22_06690 [Chloroflexi bacterium]|nr:hypothetical protein [Chloroflexota bacterium]